MEKRAKERRGEARTAAGARSREKEAPRAGAVRTAVSVGLLTAVLHAAEPLVYRRADEETVAALLAYVHDRLVPALESRCEAAGLDCPVLRPERYRDGHDTVLNAGRAGGTPRNGTPGRPLPDVRFRDADGNGRPHPAEIVWVDVNGNAVFDPGEPVLRGAPEGIAAGMFGRPLPGRVLWHDADGSGTPDAHEPVWIADRAADLSALRAVKRTVELLIPRFLNPAGPRGGRDGDQPVEAWTERALLADIGDAGDVRLPGPLEAARDPEALRRWAVRQAAILNRLTLRPSPSWELFRQSRGAAAVRGPHYRLQVSCGDDFCAAPGGGGSVRRLVLSSGLSFNPRLRFAEWRLESAPPASECPLVLDWESRSYGGRTQWRYRLRCCLVDTPHGQGWSESPDWRGAYGVYSFLPEPPDEMPPPDPGPAATVGPARPAEVLFGAEHSLAGGDWSRTTRLLPDSAGLAGLFAEQWEQAEWSDSSAAAAVGEVGERVLNSRGGRPEILRTLRRTVARVHKPEGCRLQVHVRILERRGGPGCLAGLPEGLWHALESVRDPRARPVERIFSPSGPAEIPEEDADLDAGLRFELRGILDFAAHPAFAPLPAPPETPPPEGLRSPAAKDLAADGLVDPGADLLSFGPDTGAFVLQPDSGEARVMLPLGATRRRRVPVHAYLTRAAGAAAAPNRHWSHADAGADQRFHFSLHTRAFTETVAVTARERLKIAAVIRPRGTRVLFGFEPDADGGFSAVGFPLPPNDRMDYVLRDTTPGDHLDGHYELQFGSGIVHVFAAGAGAERFDGRLACIRHPDGGRSYPLAAFGHELDLRRNRFRVPRWDGALQWSGGLLTGILYRSRAGGGEIELRIGRDESGRIGALRKSIPELSETLTDEGGGRLTVSAGSGIRVQRDGARIRRTLPGRGAVTREWSFNDDGLPVRITTRANGGSRGLRLHYRAGQGRCEVSGLPLWTRLTGIDRSDGGWERRHIDPRTGRLLRLVTPSGNSGPDDPPEQSRVVHFSYDHALSAGEPADPHAAVELPRRVIVTERGVEIGRLYAARDSAGGLRRVRLRRCRERGASWEAPGNLETVIRDNRLGPPGVVGPAFRRDVECSPADGGLRITVTDERGRVVERRINAFGYSEMTEVRQAPPEAPWYPLTLMRVEALTDGFGRPVRLTHLDGTVEQFSGIGWHGGAAECRLRDGSSASIEYLPCGLPRTVSRYGVTAEYTYDDLGMPRSVTQRAGGLSTTVRFSRDAAGEPRALQDALGRTTAVERDGSGREIRFADGARARLDIGLDGTPLGWSGTALPDTVLRHHADPENGAWSERLRYTAAGLTDRAAVYRNLLGLPERSERGAPGRGGVEYAYDRGGRLQRVRDADGVTALFEYAPESGLLRAALDLDGDGVFSEADRIVSARGGVAAAVPPGCGSWTACLKRTVTDSAGGARLSEFVSADGEHRWRVLNGRTTHTRIRRGDGPGEWTATTVFPDGTARIREFEAGLLKRIRGRDTAGMETLLSSLRYDPLRRLQAVIDERTGEQTAVERDGAGRIVRRRRSDTAADTRLFYDQAGRLSALRRPGGGTLRIEYTPAGLPAGIGGDGVAPRRLAYDPRGLCTALTTFRDGLDGDGAALTEWDRDPYSARPLEKRIDGQTVETRRYSAAGRLRAVERGRGRGAVTTRIGRNAAGEVERISRSDGSPDIVLSRDAAGRIVRVSDRTGTRSRSFDRDGRLTRESLPHLPGAALEIERDAAGRRAVLSLTVDGRTVLRHAVEYDSHGRVGAVSDGRCRAGYTYRAPGAPLERMDCSSGGTPRLSVGRGWDTRGRLTGIRAELPAAGGREAASWRYTLDEDGRRVRCDISLEDPAEPGRRRGRTWLYSYDPSGQLSRARCLDPDGGGIMPGRDFRFEHDTLHNRIRAARDGGGGAQTYSANRMNQYLVRTVPGAVHVSGDARADAEVTVNGVAAGRRGTRFHARIPVDNARGPVALTLTVTAVAAAGRSGEDLLGRVEIPFTVPAADELLSVSESGALVADSLRRFSWDADDRLVAAETVGPPPPADSGGMPGAARAAARPRRAEYLYDWMGRRAVLRRFAHGPRDGEWEPPREIRFVYDGWRLLAECEIAPDGSVRLLRSYLYGPDLAGMHTGSPSRVAGAAGIGGVVAMTDHSAGGAACFVLSDGIGSVCALIDAETDIGLLETVEYAPFGAVLARRFADGAPDAAARPSGCPLGFSGRPRDPDGLIYFGLRYYCPDLGRWLCRDPIAENGGVNLYAYCRNDPVNAVDPIGLAELITGDWELYEEGACYRPASIEEEDLLLTVGQKQFDWHVEQDIRLTEERAGRQAPMTAGDIGRMYLDFGLTYARAHRRFVNKLACTLIGDKGAPMIVPQGTVSAGGKRFEVIFTNGIMNDELKVLDSVKEFADETNCPVTCIHNPTAMGGIGDSSGKGATKVLGDLFGAGLDILQVAHEQIGLTDDAATGWADYVTARLIDNPDLFIVAVGHSAGGAKIRQGFGRVPESLRGRMYIITAAGAQLGGFPGAARVIRVNKKGDYICGPLGNAGIRGHAFRFIARQQANDSHIDLPANGIIACIPIIGLGDHGFADNYLDTTGTLVQIIIETQGNLPYAPTRTLYR